MENFSILKNNIKWNYKTTSMLVFLLLLPNLLGQINLTTPYGFKIHFFQISIIAAALLFGPTGGLLSGLVGSLYVAFLQQNPYIIIGNALLGFFIGIFIRLKYSVIISVLLAYLVQLPWLFVSDYFLMGLPINFIFKLSLALLFSNFIWALVVNSVKKPLINFIR